MRQEDRERKEGPQTVQFPVTPAVAEFLDQDTKKSAVPGRQTCNDETRNRGHACGPRRKLTGRHRGCVVHDCRRRIAAATLTQDMAAHLRYVLSSQSESHDRSPASADQTRQLHDALCESPSIGIIWPEIERPAGDARKTASAAGSTKRLIDWLASAAASSSATLRPLTEARP